MKLLFVLMILICGIFASIATSQTPIVERTPTPQDINLQTIQRQQITDREFENLKNVKDNSSRVTAVDSPRVYQNIKLIYRKPTSKELDLLAPDKVDVDRFAEFLRQPDTGLLKLAANKDCGDTVNVISATADCLAYTMPGAGSSYSFRVGSYRISRLADITFNENSFLATGIRLNGIFVDIGNVPLEKVTLQTKGMDFLAKFHSETDIKKAIKIDKQLSEGIEKDGFIYRSLLPALNNTTYVLRSIAYRGKYLLSVRGVTYNELDFDKRSDIIIAFRIVHRHADGAITILWKQLSKQNSPKVDW